MEFDELFNFTSPFIFIKTYIHFIVKPIILRYANQDNCYHVMQWDIVNVEHSHPTYPSLIFKWNRIQLQASWMSQCDKTLECRNMTSTFMNVTMWQRLFSMSHIRHNVTLTLINVIMWHRLSLMSYSDINFDKRWLTMVNFDVRHNVTLTLMNAIMGHQLSLMSQCKHQLWWLPKCGIHQRQPRLTIVNHGQLSLTMVT